MVKTNFKDAYKLLTETIPTLGQAIDTCCDDIRDEHLFLILKELFDEIKLPYDQNLLESNPIKYYTILRKYILNDTTLSNEQKISLINSFMT